MRYSLLLAVACASPLSAATIVLTDNTVSTIPDGSSSGLARSLTVNAGGQTVTGVQVDVNVSASGAGYIGDLYLYLTNGSTVSVLANRPGRRAGSPGGYGDSQPVTVTFADSGAADFHAYRLPVTGSNATPLSAPLTGIWQPDARLVDPGTVLDTDARTAMLSVFNGSVADGTWSLFAADLSSGAVHQLNSWTLRIDTIPEPAAATVGVLTAVGMLLRRRRS